MFDTRDDFDARQSCRRERDERAAARADDDWSEGVRRPRYAPLPPAVRAEVNHELEAAFAAVDAMFAGLR